MFDQTFVPEQPETTKRFSVAASLAIQVLAIVLVVIASLVYSQGLPVRQLRSLLYVPKAPVAAQATQTAHHAIAAGVHRVFTLSRIQFRPLTAVHPIAEAEPKAPDLTGAASDGVESGPDIFFGGPSIVANAPAPAFDSHPKTRSGPVRVGGQVAAANLIHSVTPPYPILARNARVQGTVEFTAVIGKDGTIQHLQLVHGHPLLVQAATDAVLKWRYRPTLLNDEPTEVMTDITVNFSLSQ